MADQGFRGWCWHQQVTNPLQILSYLNFHVLLLQPNDFRTVVFSYSRICLSLYEALPNIIHGIVYHHTRLCFLLYKILSTIKQGLVYHHTTILLPLCKELSVTIQGFFLVSLYNHMRTCLSL